MYVQRVQDVPVLSLSLSFSLFRKRVFHAEVGEENGI